MSDPAELALRETFAEDAYSTVLRSDLVAGARMRVRRRRRLRGVASGLAVVAVAGVAALLAQGRQAPAIHVATLPPLVVQPGPPVAAAGIDQVKPLIGRARLERAVVIDGGAVRLLPTAAEPALSEARAIRLWAAASPGGGVFTGDPVVFLADVTLTVQPSRPATQPGVRLPRFEHRAAWVMIWNEAGSSFFCPYIGPSATPSADAPRSLDAIARVQMIAADGSGEGIVYSVKSRVCVHDVPASAEVGWYDVSVPWSYSSGSDGAPVAAFAVPDCGVIGGTSTDSSPASSQTVVSVEVSMVRGPCASPSAGSVPLTQTGPGPSHPPDQRGHGPTGLLLGRYSAMSNGTWSLTYFDGTPHTLLR